MELYLLGLMAHSEAVFHHTQHGTAPHVLLGKVLDVILLRVRLSYRQPDSLSLTHLVARVSKDSESTHDVYASWVCLMHRDRERTTRGD